MVLIPGVCQQPGSAPAILNPLLTPVSEQKTALFSYFYFPFFFFFLKMHLITVFILFYKI